MDKVVFITGGSTGIGNACVHKFHKKGYKCFYGYKSREGV
ncbi:SDR family NAD(P)-dependent oxidoreductase [Helicobacter burdigaliensis]|nr:SDR family NAD(P)-dependent oxidoreductase [Helicobacter burdigaliensis]